MARVRRLSGATALDVALVVFIAVLTERYVFGHGDPALEIDGPRWLTVPLPLLIALPLAKMCCSVMTATTTTRATSRSVAPVDLRNFAMS